jgi:hypothetical protein
MCRTINMKIASMFGFERQQFIGLIYVLLWKKSINVVCLSWCLVKSLQNLVLKFYLL